MDKVSRRRWWIRCAWFLSFLGFVVLVYCALSPLFYWSRVPIWMQALLIPSTTIVLFTILHNGRRQFLKASSKSDAGSQRGPYSVPRRFRLSTMIVVTTLFTMLCAFLKWTEIHVAGFVFITTLFGFVAILQFVLDKVPRTASILAGSVFLPVAIVIVYLANGQLDHLTTVSIGELIIGGMVFFLLGAIVGYFVGALVAGIFLVIDGVAIRVFAKTK